MVLSKLATHKTGSQFALHTYLTVHTRTLRQAIILI